MGAFVERIGIAWALFDYNIAVNPATDEPYPASIILVFWDGVIWLPSVGRSAVLMDLILAE